MKSCQSVLTAADKLKPVLPTAAWALRVKGKARRFARK